MTVPPSGATSVLASPMAAPSRPSVPRQKSHVPGGFDTDEDLSPVKTTFDDDDMAHVEGSPSRGPYLAPHDATSHEGSSMMDVGNDTFLQEREMRKRLEDFDSTFLQEVSPVVHPRQPTIGQDLSSITEESSQSDPSTTTERTSYDEPSAPPEPASLLHDPTPESPSTPPGEFYTPAPGRTERSPRGEDDTPGMQGHANASSLETMSSSPTAAAAARTISRVVSTASTSNETVDESRGGIMLNQEETPPRDRDQSATPIAGSPTPTRAPHSGSRAPQPFNEPPASPSAQRRRPSYLNSRVASGRSSHSSRTTTSTDGGSDITLGADYALQSGGAIPQSGSIRSRPTDFSRSVSLASFASGISGISDRDDRIDGTEGRLFTVKEHDLNKEPQTPSTSNRTISTPTDTVIAQHVKDVQVPETLAREYGNRPRQLSPERRAGAPTPGAGRNANNLTLKEQSSTIDRLVKENWNLKLKITFLDEALNRKSDDSIKAMISENVDLRTAKFQSAKETRELRRSMRDLERKLKEKSEELSQKLNASTQEAAETQRDDEAFVELEEELTYLRERVTTYDIEIEKMRNESFVQETEKKKLAEVVKQMSTTSRGTDIGAREEVDLWKDLLDAETARREQADEDNRRLREEIRRLKSDSSSSSTNNHATNVYNVSRRQKLSHTVSYNGSERGVEQNGASSAVSNTLVEQLRHENAELRREVGAQTSMLTSRNREKEWLTQEIEDLKLGLRRGDGTRSTAGDSIFERSASRAHGRPGSRASDQTRTTQLSDIEREAFELKNGQLRDQNTKLRLEIQSLAGQADQLLDELEQLDALKIDHEKLQQLYDNDISLATEDLQTLQRERDDALRIQEDMDGELQDLKAEGSERIGALEEELDQRNSELENMQQELSNRAEDTEALRKEVRTLSESMLRIEEEVEVKNKRVRTLELELEELGHEADVMDKDLREEKDKNNKLSVQHESTRGEVAFLREEQEGDKMKIGDLEDALNNLEASLASERDRAKELDDRITEERHQRELIGSKEKQEVQKMMNELNRDSSSAKDEARKLKKNLESKTVESKSYQERLHELETHLREVLGDPNGSRPTFLVTITKMQNELEQTLGDLERAQHSLADKERLLRNRDSLLESHGLESKKLSDLLERERQGRRADKAQHEQWQRTHQHTSRTVTQKDARISELEGSRSADRKRISSLETQFKDQLSERNNLLLTLWGRISTICGPDWQKQNSLINNHLPTPESITNTATYTPFSKTLLSAVNKMEDTISTFQARIKTLDRTLWADYQSLEHTLDARIKKLDKLDSTVQAHRISGTFTAAPEIAKLRGENRLLKSELTSLQKSEMHARVANRSSSSSSYHQQNANNDTAAPPPMLSRHHSSSAVEHLQQHSPTSPSASRKSVTKPTSAEQDIVSPPIEPSQQRWIHRLRELERRLKAEREARLLDRSGARKRLEEGAEENRRLKGELARERVRKGGDVVGGGTEGGE